MLLYVHRDTHDFHTAAKLSIQICQKSLSFFKEYRTDGAAWSENVENVQTFGCSVNIQTKYVLFSLELPLPLPS